MTMTIKENNNSWVNEKRKKIITILMTVLFIPLAVLMFHVNENRGTTENQIKWYYMGFAVDNNQNIYIGRLTRIDVYSNNEFQYSIDAHTSRGYAFTITEDQTILLSTSIFVYEMTLDGEIISKYEDKNTRTINELQKKKNMFISEDGTIYKYNNWTHDITRVEGESEIVIFHVDLT